MPQLVTVEGEERPLVELEGDYTALNPKQRLALTYLAMGKKPTWIQKKCALAEYTLKALMCRSDAKNFVAEMVQGSQLQMQALIVKGVDCIRETMEKGKYPDKIKATRLLFETQKLIGSGTMPMEPLVDANVRLTELAERLLKLNDNANRTIQTRRSSHEETIIEGQCLPSPAQAAGRGERFVPEGDAEEPVR